jgi:excisionase family DNA binding protein
MPVRKEGLVLTVLETAKELRVHPLTVRRAIKRGDLPAVTVGRRVLVPRKALEDWLSRTAGQDGGHTAIG